MNYNQHDKQEQVDSISKPSFMCPYGVMHAQNVS